MHEIILVAVGFIVAFIGSMSGGGAGLLSLFALLSFGLPINQAIATNKFSDLGFFGPALHNFSKAKYLNRQALPAIITVNLVGVLLGTLLISYLEIDLLTELTVFILGIIIISNLITKDFALRERPAHRLWPIPYFITSVFSGAIGAGTGILSTLVLVYFRGFTALKAMANSFFANMFGSILSVVILMLAGLVRYDYGVCLLAGNIVGSYIGSKIAIRKGNEFVRIMIILMAVIVLVRLLLQS